MFILPTELINYISNYSYLILIFVLLQGSLVVILIYLFAEQFSNTKKRKLEDEVVHNEAHKAAVRSLEEAKDTSIKIIGDAHIQAQELLKSSATVSEQMSKDLHDKLSQISDSHIQSLEQTSSKISEDLHNVLKQEGAKGATEIEKISTIVTQGIVTEVENFKEILRKDTYEAEQQVERKIQDEYSAVREEIDTYKKDKLSKIDASIFKIISEVTTNTIGVSLDLDMHQNIIRKILQEAKSNNKLF